MNFKIYAAAAIILTAMTTEAQTVTFDTQDYKQIGVYDTWPASPFRTGVLTGNVAVTDNHLSDPDSNPTSGMAAVERSRYGSNTFGIRIDLNEPFKLTTSMQYVHVMIHKPVEGRVMLIGLGKRTERTAQNPDTEQFWVYSSGKVGADRWYDAVFPVKGAGGIDIYSLVVVPHCEAPHTLDGNFVAYIDEIVVDDSPAPRFGAGDYPVNFDTEITNGRTDRYLRGVRLNASDNGVKTIDVPEGNKVYNVVTDPYFSVKPGTRLNPAVVYTGNWMHAYMYLDKGNDGKFNPETDLLTYSYYDGSNSAGTSLEGSSRNTLTMPAVTLPEDVTPGFYRLRYKVDWDCIDPAGSMDAANPILGNGGGIMDVLLNVRPDECVVNNANRNGDVLLSDGSGIDALRVPTGEPLTIRMQPSNGFSYSGIMIRVGYNLKGDSLIHSNPQYRDILIPADEFGDDDTYTIPGSLIDCGEMIIEGLFIEGEKPQGRTTVTYRYMANGKELAVSSTKVMPGAAYPDPTFECQTDRSYYTLSDKPTGTVPAEDITVEIEVIPNLPFEVSRSYDHAYWYNINITADGAFLIYEPGQTAIPLDASTTQMPEGGDYAAQWCFVGDVADGFEIFNREAGADMVLSSATELGGNTGGNCYPLLTPRPVPDTHNGTWIAMPSQYRTDKNGFYLHQSNLPANKMNRRNGLLAYWNGGQDAGSTFAVLLADDSTGLENIAADSDSTARYYNLQGVPVRPDRLQPGIYIRATSNGTSKLIIP